MRGLGQANTAVDVADGYAHNFLFPRKYAVAATEEKIKELEAKKAQLEAQRQKEEEQLMSKVASLNGKKVTIAARATEKGGLFKAITPADVAKAIRLEHSLEIPETAIAMDHIKTVGEHAVRLKSKTKESPLTVVIAPGA